MLFFYTGSLVNGNRWKLHAHLQYTFLLLSFTFEKHIIRHDNACINECFLLEWLLHLKHVLFPNRIHLLAKWMNILLLFVSSPSFYSPILLPPWEIHTQRGSPEKRLVYKKNLRGITCNLKIWPDFQIQSFYFNLRFTLNETKSENA